MTADQGGRGRRRCPTGKLKYFNEAWAQIGAAQQTERLGGSFRPYVCRCGWWHIFDKAKQRRKENARESRSARRKRSRRGEPPPGEALRREQKRLKRARYKRRQRARREAEALPLRVWEDDGGACM